MDGYYSDSSDERRVRARILPVETKNHVCRQVIDNLESYSNVSNVIGIQQRTVRQWVMKVKGGRKLHGKEGRPPLVEDDTLDKIRSHIMDNIGISDEDLKAFIRREYNISTKRKLEEVIDEEDSNDGITYKLKSNTLYRLVRKLKSEFEHDISNI